MTKNVFWVITLLVAALVVLGVLAKKQNIMAINESHPTGVCMRGGSCTTL